MTELEDSDDEPKTPTVTIAFEYIEAEETFNFYIRRVSHAPYTPSLYPRYSRAVMHIVKGLTRKTWMGKKRSITWEEMLARDPMVYKTLAVPRCVTTVFNEFFTCQIAKQVFHSTLMKIQFCDVSRDELEVLLDDEREARQPYSVRRIWENSNYRSHTYQRHNAFCSPTVEPPISTSIRQPKVRRVLDIWNGSGIESLSEIHVRAILFVDGRFDEIHKSEHRLPADETPSGLSFSKKLVFDLMRMDLHGALIVCQVVQRIKGR
ncbi:unnamed protein product [Heligmosomoides polygyrus]|uniref:PAZ domain-containing protein n=1 Tax=Heligmosomoides polygyrus TaxID=6339 RepID=A0A3P7YAC3_HELPZ|nr:unnamed protein product [Heligmosomoides polygyrus]